MESSVPGACVGSLFEGLARGLRCSLSGRIGKTCTGVCNMLRVAVSRFAAQARSAIYHGQESPPCFDFEDWNGAAFGDFVRFYKDANK